MTDKIADTLNLEGKTYEIVNWHGNTECIPSSEKLGFKTVSRSTANYHGRVDHFGVWGDKFYLFKVEVSLDDPENTPLPENARREKLFRYEQMYYFDGTLATCREYRYDYFVYEDLTVPYSGWISIKNVIDEGWNKPEFAPEQVEEDRILLTFENGILIDYEDIDCGELDLLGC
jgi:hypothetical protein